MPLKRAEAILAGTSGLIAGAGGVLTLLWAWLDRSTTVNAPLVVALGMAAAAALSGTVGGIIHVKQGGSPGLAVTWLSAAFLLFLSLTLLASFAPVFLAAAAFGFASGVIGLLRKVNGGRVPGA